MGAQGKSPRSSNSMQRVKVYHLSEDGKWDDRGTGHVTVDYVERSEDLGLFVIDEEDNETLLAHRIRSDDIYRTQEDTIISWRDPDFATELALSFQEAAGCSYIWEQICNVQRNLHFNTLSDLEIGPRPPTETLEAPGTAQGNDETFHNGNSELRELPAVELSTLPLILKTLLESGVADHMRITELIVQDQDFFPKLMDLFRICEDMENIDSLHMIFKIVKGIILLNSSHIFEKIFADEFIMDIIGCLEYDPEISRIQHHRTFLKEHVIFKEAVPIKDPSVVSKIHETYRIGYIKDVVLPRVLDEATVASLNSIIHANNAVVVSSLKEDSAFFPELFARMRSPSSSVESKKNLVLFLHEYCALVKSLQVVQQMRLYRDLVNEGIFDIITDVLQSEDKNLVLPGTDVLILFLNQDPNLLRSYVTRQEGNALLGLLVKGMITDFGEDMNCQFLEIIRSLLDSYTLSGSQQRETIIEIFYEKHLDQLIDVIVLSCPQKRIDRRPGKPSLVGTTESQGGVKPEILSNVCELLCFCVHHHPYRIKCSFLFNNAIEKVLFLTRRREKYLVVAAIRFVRAIISRNDEQILHHIAKNNLLKPIVEAFVANGNRYNLLNSAVLELFGYIRKESLKTLVFYLVDSFWNQLAKLEHFTTVHGLKIKYEQFQDTDDIRSLITAADQRKRIDARALEKEEEDYFNEDSDDDETASAQTSQVTNQQAQSVLPNGGNGFPLIRSTTGGLVDYEDDDDEEDVSPPSRSKLPNSQKDKRKVESKHSSKRVSVESEEPDLAKRRRVDEDSADSNVSHAANSSDCSDSTSPVDKSTAPMLNGPQNAESKSASHDEAQPDKAPAVPRSCSSCLPNAVDARSPAVDECSLVPPNGNSTLEKTANGTNSTGSEPYSVR
ncbi:hypothetical protein Scep_008880 [Stephania cephalantha]|uniref:Serine/threonine-protein phosphatase 4 regulatory subunit 3-like central domain-containing protein n=1 Tax=Stephania cephalantha TaxID=152367 RepID=A0AAP0JSM7_9MAGN